MFRPFSDSLCNYIKNNSAQFSGHNLQTSPSMLYDISVDQIWRWDNSLGALGHFFVSANSIVSPFHIMPFYYIDLYPNDEYGLTKLHINSNGEAVK